MLIELGPRVSWTILNEVNKNNFALLEQLPMALAVRIVISDAHNQHQQFEVPFLFPVGFVVEIKISHLLLVTLHTSNFFFVSTRGIRGLENLSAWWEGGIHAELVSFVHDGGAAVDIVAKDYTSRSNVFRWWGGW